MSVVFATVLGSNSVTIAKNPQHSSSFDDRRVNQITQETGQGNFKTFDNGSTVREGILIIRLLTKTEADNMRDFIVNKCRFARFQFTITPPSSVDLGAGDGQVVTCNFNGGPKTKGVITPMGKAAKFILNLPYRYRVNPSTATVDAEGNIS